jgi:hypothetical protein
MGSIDVFFVRTDSGVDGIASFPFSLSCKPYLNPRHLSHSSPNRDALGAVLRFPCQWSTLLAGFSLALSFVPPMST